MDYNRDNLARDKAKTWKSFNKLTLITIIFIAIILVIIFLCFNYPTISSLSKNLFLFLLSELTMY